MEFLSDILIKAGLVVEGSTALGGVSTAQTPSLGDNSTKIATTAFIKGQGYLDGSSNLDWNKVINRPSDLAGYGITNAYTKTEIGQFFSGAVAITGYNRANWDEAYSHMLQWNGGSEGLSVETARATLELGDMALESTIDYYTKVAIQSFFSGATAISGYNKSNWDTAYGWGNHALAGYLTTISGIAAGGELDGTYANPTLKNSAVIGKLLTGLNVTGGSVVATDSILTAFGKVQNQINGLVGGMQFVDFWDASTNTPTLPAASPANKGKYYIVQVAGSTNIDGITDWKVGDWAVSNGSVYGKIDNTDAVVSVNGFTGPVSLTTSNIPEGIELYFNNTRARAALSFTAGSGAYNSTTGVITIPTNNNQIANGAGYITSAALTGYATEAWVNSGFYTKSEVQNFFSGASAMTGYNRSNWDTAFGWGPHAGLYYTLGSTVANSTLWNGLAITLMTYVSGTVPSALIFNATNNSVEFGTWAQYQSFLGLGSAAYTASSAYYAAGSTVVNSTLWGGYAQNIAGGPYGGAPDTIAGFSSTTLQRYNATAIQLFLGLGSAAYITASQSAVANTVAQRTNEADIFVRLLRTEWTGGEAGNGGYILMQNSIGAGAVDNYARPTSMNTLRDYMNLGDSNSTYMRYQGFTLDANTMLENRTGFTYASNAPYTGPILHVGAAGYGLQLNATYSGGGELLAFRSRNGDTASWNGWNSIWHEGNFTPTNYVPYTGATTNVNLGSRQLLASYIDAYNVETVNRTTYQDLLYVTANATSLPYGGHGGGIVFRGSTYQQNGSNVTYARIGTIINSDSVNSYGSTMFFDIATNSSGSVFRAFELYWTGNARFFNNLSVATGYAGYALNVGGSVYIDGNYRLADGNIVTNQSGNAYLTFGSSVVSVNGLLAPNNGLSVTNGRSVFTYTSPGLSYTQAGTEIYSSGTYGPRLSLHWGGVVASQIGVESSGRIAMLNNPGTSYENLIANNIWAAAHLYVGGNIVGSGAASFVNSVSASSFAVGEMILNSNQLYRNSSNEMYLNYSGGGNTILGNSSGNVGINAGTNPAYRLHVGGTLGVTSTGIFGGRTIVGGGYITDAGGSGNSSGIGFGSSGIYPVDGGASYSSTKDLGYDSLPWRSAYLSGAIRRTNPLGGYLHGGYAGVETSTTPGLIYAIGDGYLPTSSATATMYGIGYTNSAFAGNPLGTSGWGLYVAGAGTMYHWLGTDMFKTIVPIVNTSATMSTFTGAIQTQNVLKWYGGVGSLSFGGANVTMETNDATAIQFKTNGVLALTLATNQSSTFSGNVNISSGNSLSLIQGDIYFQSNGGYGILSANASRLMVIQNGQLSMQGILQMSANNLGFNEGGVRSWTVGASSGNLYFNSGDGGGNHIFQSNSVSANYYDAQYGGAYGSYNGKFDWNLLQLGNNGPNYIVGGDAVVGGWLDFYVNNTNNVVGSTPNGVHAMRINNTGYIHSYLTFTAPNFQDFTGPYNVNLGNGGSEGRGIVAGYSGGNYGGIGYNIRHTGTSSSWIAPGGDNVSYLAFNAGFTFSYAPGGAAGRDISSTMYNVARLDNVGNFASYGAIYPGFNNGNSLVNQSTYYINGWSSDNGLRTNGNWLVGGDLYIAAAGISTWLTNWLNQSVKTNGTPTFQDVYVNDWFRNNNANRGLYNQATNAHFYSSSSAQWDLAGSQGAYLQLAMRVGGHGSTIRGYLYADSGNNIGILGYDGNWALRMDAAKTLIGYNGAQFVNDVSTTVGQGRFGGWYTGSNFTGAAVEVGYSGGTGNVIAYNRNTGVYSPIYLAGSEVNLTPQGGSIRATGNIVMSNYGLGLVGLYNSTLFQAVFAMGESYMLPNNGANTGSLYGLAWSHPNAGGQAANLGTHGLLVVQNGTTIAAISNNLWVSNNVIASGDIYHGTRSVWLSSWLNQAVLTTSNVTFNTVYAAGNITAYSDARLKENVFTIDNALNKVMGMRGVYFNRIGILGPRETGVIAQEVMSVLPEVVHKNGDIHSVAYGNIVGVLIEAIKELKQELNDLKKIANGPSE